MIFSYFQNSMLISANTRRPSPLLTQPTATSPLQQTRFALLSGQFLPGQKLKPDHMKAAFGVSSGTMREVLLRLVGEGLVEIEEQRGFSVPQASLARLAELTKLRAMIECEGARLSIQNGDLEWEARLNAAHHKLSHIEQRFKDSQNPRELIPFWTRADNEFHEVLVDACGSSTLRTMRANLFHRARQQVVACDPSFGFRSGTVPEHADILNAALARDAETCAKAISLHLTSFQDSLNVEPLAQGNRSANK